MVRIHEEDGTLMVKHRQRQNMVITCVSAFFLATAAPMALIFLVVGGIEFAAIPLGLACLSLVATTAPLFFMQERATTLPRHGRSGDNVIRNSVTGKVVARTKFNIRDVDHVELSGEVQDKTVTQHSTRRHRSPQVKTVTVTRRYLTLVLQHGYRIEVASKTSSSSHEAGSALSNEAQRIADHLGVDVRAPDPVVASEPQVITYPERPDRSEPRWYS